MRLPGNSALHGASRRVALAAAVAAVLVPTSGAAVPPDEGETASAEEQAPAGEQTPAEEAVEVLEEVEEALDPGEDPQPFFAPGPEEGTEQVDVTTELAGLSEVYDDLPAAQRGRADRLLARPTDKKDGDGFLVNYKAEKVKNTCNEQVCVHWVEEGDHAATAAWAETVLDEVTHAWDVEVGELGYRRPVPDGKVDDPDDRTDRLDVYIGDIGSQSYYGYVVPEKPKKGTAYMVLDKDYATLGGEDALKVTAAHEFFHVLQFGYRPNADAWVMEATATWIEEQVHDEINDNRQYLRFSALNRPQLPLDTADSLTPYGNWIFFQHLSQQYGPKVVRAIWNQIGKGRPTPRAINRALRNQGGSTIREEFASFTSANVIPAVSYDEGKADYPRAKPVKKPRLGKARRATTWQLFPVDHLAATTFAYRHHGALNDKWRLRVRAKGPKRIRGTVLVKRTDGQFRSKPFVLKGGSGATAVNFGSKRIAWVAVTLANTAVKPKHDGTKVRLRAAVKKRP